MNYTISEVSALLDVKKSTLHYYERTGILEDVKKNDSGHRVYSEETVEFLKLIRCMRHTGMGIADIKRYVVLCQQGDDTISIRHTIFVQQNNQLDKQLKELEEYKQYVEKKINYYQDKLSKGMHD